MQSSQAIHKARWPGKHDEQTILNIHQEFIALANVQLLADRLRQNGLVFIINLYGGCLRHGDTSQPAFAHVIIAGKVIMSKV